MSIIAMSADTEVLERSRAYCRDLTRREAKNFYYGLKLLPEPKRSAMYALYAYMRLVDDIADAEDERSAEERRRDLDAWQARTHAVMEGTEADHAEMEDGATRRHLLWPAFGDLVRRYGISREILDEMVAGQRQDLEVAAIETFFEDLYPYCYRVASVVGLASICVFGYEGGQATEELAVARGVAFQLTNVLRDLREDAGKQRCYVPADELAKFGVTQADLAAGRATGGFEELMRFEIARAQEFYEKSRGLEERLEPESRPTMRAMTGIYHGLLQKIAVEPTRVLRGRVSLSAWKKVGIGWKALRGSTR